MSQKVLLIYPACLYDGGWVTTGRSYQPQLLVLYSYLKERGMDVETLELDNEIGHPRNPNDLALFPHKVRKLLSQHSFDIVGISCYTSACYLSSLLVAEICKELNPRCQVAVGGYHATVVPGDFLERPDLFDYIVRGEGEDVLLEICQGLHSCKYGSPKIIQGIPRSLHQGIQLYWEDYKYTRNHRTLPLSLGLTRGCPFRCIYCVESTLNFKPRVYPVDLALRDIKKAVEVMDPYYLMLDDPLFPLYSDWGQELLTALAKENFRIPLNFMTRIDLLKEQHLEVLTKLNVNIFLGVETCSQKMLEIMQKTKNPQMYLNKIAENLPLINERRIFATLSFILNHPGDSEVILNETIGFLENTYSRVPHVSTDFIHQEFVYLPGTVVSENLQYYEREFGTVIKHKTWWKEHGNHMLLSRDVIPGRDALQEVDWRLKWVPFLEKILNNRKIDQKSFLLQLWLRSHRQNEGNVAYALSGQ